MKYIKTTILLSFIISYFFPLLAKEYHATTISPEVECTLTPITQHHMLKLMADTNPLFAASEAMIEDSPDLIENVMAVSVKIKNNSKKPIFFHREIYFSEIKNCYLSKEDIAQQLHSSLDSLTKNLFPYLSKHDLKLSIKKTVFTGFLSTMLFLNLTTTLGLDNYQYPFILKAFNGLSWLTLCGFFWHNVYDTYKAHKNSKNPQELIQQLTIKLHELLYRTDDQGIKQKYTADEKLIEVAPQEEAHDVIFIDRTKTDENFFENSPTFIGYIDHKII